jgi:hypothetical protein
MYLKNLHVKIFLFLGIFTENVSPQTLLLILYLFKLLFKTPCITILNKQEYLFAFF